MPNTDLVAILFVREAGDPLTSLVKKIDKRVEEAIAQRAADRKRAQEQLPREQAALRALEDEFNLSRIGQLDKSPLQLEKEVNEQRAKIARLQQTANRNPRPLGIYIIFCDNARGLDGQLRQLAEKETLKKVSLAIEGDASVLQRYGVAADADVTAMVYTRNRVVANFALRKGELNEEKSDAILEALSKVLPR